jgi:two-component system, sensor histidine kinase ChiS
MPKTKILFLIVWFFFTFCKREEQVTIVRELTPNVTLSSVFAQPATLFEAPKSIKAAEPITIKPDPSISSEEINNIQLNLSKKIIIAGDPIVRTPGEEGLDLPFILPARDSSFVAGIPEPVPVPIAYSKTPNPHSFRFYTRLQGLQHDIISSLVNDKKGNLWIGTYGGGVTRFDGRNFFHYTVDHGLPSNTVLSLLEDTKGNIWIGTREGVVRFDGRHFSVFTVRQGLSHDIVEKIFEDNNGDIWFGTYQGGVYRYDGRSFTHYAEQQGLAFDVVYAITQDHFGNMWFGTRGGGISRYDGKSFANYTLEQGLSSNFIISGITDHKGELWFGTDSGGLVHFDGETFTIYSSDDNPFKNDIVSLLEDNRGNIWFGTRQNGLVCFDRENFRLFDESQGLLNEYITYIEQDKNGNIWFGTFGHGLGQFQGNRFTHYGENVGISDSFIRSVIHDSKGRVWIGSHRQGIFIIEEGWVTNISETNGLPGNSIRSMIEDSKGNFWISISNGGVVKFDGENFQKYSTEEGLPDNLIYTLMEDTDGNIWMGTASNGVVKFDGENFTQYTTESGLSDNNIRKIIQDQEGNIWIATMYGGITKYDGEIFFHFNEQCGLGSNDILDMIEGTDGVIWIGTNGKGLIRFDGQSFVHFTEKEGLVNNFVYSLLEDKDKNIWAGTRQGLSRFLNQNYAHQLDSFAQDQISNDDAPLILFKNYNQDDGYLGIGTNSRCMTEDNEGNIWVGANDILTKYHRAGDNPDTIPPVLSMTGIGIFNEMFDWCAIGQNFDTTIVLGNGVKLGKIKFDHLSEWYGVPEGMVLSHKNNFLTFQFTNININFQGKVLFRYMLEGIDEYWSSLIRRTDVSYGNLSPGKYTFKVMAVNSEGIWSDELRYSFLIKFPWWQTWWASVIYLFLVGLAIVLIYLHKLRKYREDKLKNYKEQLLREEIAIARQSAEFKQNFLANMSHEIRTPLTGILGMAEILNKTPLNDDQKDYLQTLMLSGDNLRETINMVLDYSKIEAGKMQLNKDEFVFQSIFSEAEKIFTALNKHNLSLEIFVDPDIPEKIIADQRRISQVVNNLLSNAIKFTPQGKIVIKSSIKELEITGIKEKNLTIMIEIRDSGKGISKEAQKKLFKPFFQVEQADNRSFDGTGLGLAICKELVTLMDGKIGLESQVGKGSNFWFTFGAQSLEDENNKHIFKQDIQESRKNFTKLIILLVEDKVVNQKVVTLLLKSLGHQVVIAHNGQDALEIFLPGKFDLILMDIQMPVMDGITAVKKLKEKYSQLPPVVGLSANAFEGDREKYMNLGMDEYITKPVKQSDLERILENLGIS